MKKIVTVSHVGQCNKSDSFSKALEEAIKKLQEQELEVEIQYKVVPQGSFKESYSALLIGYQKQLMNNK